MPFVFYLFREKFSHSATTKNGGEALARGFTLQFCLWESICPLPKIFCDFFHTLLYNIPPLLRKTGIDTCKTFPCKCYNIVFATANVFLYPVMNYAGTSASCCFFSPFSKDSSTPTDLFARAYINKS